MGPRDRHLGSPLDSITSCDHGQVTDPQALVPGTQYVLNERPRLGVH